MEATPAKRVRENSARAQSGTVKLIGPGPSLLGKSAGHHQVTMAEISTSGSTIEKLNNNNYNTWCLRMQFYLLGQDLWDIIGGNSTTPPTDDE